MKSKILRGLRSLAAVLAGFVVVVVGTILTFEVVLGGIGFYKSSPTELVIATIGALASGFAGGLVAARLAGRHPLWHAAGLAVPIGLDTASFLASRSPASDPLWFDLGGSATLVLGALIAGYLVRTRGRSRKTSLEPG